DFPFDMGGKEQIILLDWMKPAFLLNDRLQTDLETSKQDPLPYKTRSKLLVPTGSFGQDMTDLQF
ncbi:hypothetical protein NPIL_299371, partial [Nephila pilipes]